ncbi:3'-5' exonuclease [Nonlabens ponticola]|uniref:3'-5' exonuclease n=1 Tax=Nonlabens ponticola TaxID=2496866 RepID=A0A3S9MUZ2_9FLAO|nr:3'-5' exonuclease [Nonlabens ponticola]AZQ42973.1 3'-5' exonuclease [Nonlabens ponticola]
MLQRLSIHNILFLDIETVPQQEDFKDLDKIDQELFAQKTQYQRRDDKTPEEFYDRAGIWAEFGKIICISVGYFSEKTSNSSFRVRSFTGEERDILMDFSALLEEHFSRRDHLLCAHNGKEFDFPYIARRLVIHGLPLPVKLNLFGKKPWEIPHLDTMELWKFGDYKHFTSIKLLTRVLGVPSPKDDIDGSQVRDVFYKENDISRIATYCEKDVIAVAQVLLRMRNEPLLKDSDIVIK